MKAEHQHDPDVARPPLLFKPVAQGATFWPQNADSGAIPHQSGRARLTNAEDVPSYQVMLVHHKHTRFILLNRPHPRAAQAL